MRRTWATPWKEVTLSATVNDDGAEVSGVTLDGTAVADTDFTDGITVPSLVVGDNVIVVTVTAEETSIILTYSITVTRATIAPGAPTDLTATAAGETRINLSWRAPTSDGGATISGYKVEVSLTGTSDWSDLVANTGTTDTTLLPHRPLRRQHPPLPRQGYQLCRDRLRIRCRRSHHCGCQRARQQHRTDRGP